MRTLICDNEIKGMAINGMEKAMDNLMPSPVQQRDFVCFLRFFTLFCKLFFCLG